jgi:hypothetical protein
VAGGASSAVAELRATGRARPRRRFRYLALLVVLGVTGLLLAHETGTSETVDLGAPAAEAHGAPAPGPAAAATPLSVEAWLGLVTAQADRPLADGTYDYRRTEYRTGPTTSVAERWAAADRDGRVILHPAARLADAGLGPIDRRVAADKAFDGVAYERLRALPADAAGLAAQLPDLQERFDVASPVATLLTLLHEPVVPPAVQGAAVSELGRRGLVAGPVPSVDDQGRAVATFALAEPAGGWDLTVDAGDGALRSWQFRRTGAAEPDTSVTVLDRRVETGVGGP